MRAVEKSAWLGEGRSENTGLVGPRRGAGGSEARGGRGRRALALALAGGATLAVAGGARAGDEKPAEKAPAVRIEEMHVVDRVEADGTVVRSQQNAISILTSAGLQQYSQILVYYFEANQKPKLTRLEIRKPDGKQLDLLATAPHDVSPVLPPGLPVIIDLKVLRYAVPSLEVGDRLDVATEIETGPLSPGRNWGEAAFAPAASVGLQDYELDAPADLPLLVHVRDGFAGKVDDEAQGGRRVRRWRLEGTKPGAEAPAAAATAAEPKRVEPDVQFTTFASWDDVAAWWTGLAPPVVDDGVKAKAAELTKGIDDPLAKLRAFDSYVAGKVRYLTLPLGIGRFKAREPDEVIRTELGDCKDKVRLLASLAAAVGIDVQPVLINASGRAFSEDLPSPAQFDHVIARAKIGGQDVWLDPTSEMTPVGRLPLQDRDKHGVGMRRGDGGAAAELVSTPAGLPFEHKIATDTVGSVSAGGVIQVKERWTFQGDDELLRLAFKYGNEDQKRKVVEGLRQEWESQAEIGEFASSDPEDLDHPFWVEFDVTWKMAHDVWGKPLDLWIPVPDVDIAVPPDAGAADLPEKLELGDVTHEVRSARIEIPPGVRVRLPVPIDIRRDFAEYRSDYRLDGGTLVFERDLTLAAKSIPKTSYADLAAFRKLAAADRAQEFHFDAAPGIVPDGSADASDLEEGCLSAGKAKRFEQAVETCRKFAAAEPQSDAAWGALGLALLELGRYDEAATALEKELAIAPNDEYAYSELGKIYEKKRDWDSAVKYLRKQIDVAPFQAYSYDELAGILLWQHRPEEVEGLLQKALRIEPDNEEYQGDLLHFYLDRKRAVDARAFILAHPKLPTGREDQLSAAALLLGDDGKWEPLRSWAERLRKECEERLAVFDGTTPDRDDLMAVQGLAYAWTALGEAAIERQDYATAEALLGASERLAFSSDAAAALSRAQRAEGKRYTADRTLALATKLDARGGVRYAKPFAAAVPDAAVRAALQETATEETWKMRSLTFRLPAAAKVSGSVWLVFDADGQLRHAEPVSKDGPRTLTQGLAMQRPAIALPKDNRARIPLLGEASCDAAGACTVVLQPPGDAWRKIAPLKPTSTAAAG